MTVITATQDIETHWYTFAFCATSAKAAREHKPVEPMVLDEAEWVEWGGDPANYEAAVRGCERAYARLMNPYNPPDGGV